MAIGTVVPEFSVMNILVAVCARSELNSFEYREFLAVSYRRGVASVTVNPCVSSRQFELCGCMVESRGGFKSILRVTTGATVSKSTLMIICVAAEAVLFETEKGSSRSFCSFSFNKFCLMTAGTRELLVFPLQFVSCTGVVKTVLNEVDYFVASAMVFAVACITHLPSGFTGMETPAGISECGNLCVACQTLGVRDLVS